MVESTYIINGPSQDKRIYIQLTLWLIFKPCLCESLPKSKTVAICICRREGVEIRLCNNSKYITSFAIGYSIYHLSMLHFKSNSFITWYGI